MKRILIFLFVFLLFGNLNVKAYTDENTESIAEEAGAYDFESDYLSSDEVSGNKSINVFEKTISIISNTLKDNGSSIIKSFGLVMCVIALCCVMHAMKFGGNETIDSAVSYISILALSGVTYSVLYNLFVFVIAAMESLTIVMTSLMPVMASLYAFGGTAASGIASEAGLTVFLTVLSAICTKVVLPLLQIAFALSLSGAMPGSINLSSVTTLVKNTATTLMAFIFTLLGFVLYLQTTIASASDNFFVRSVRFASGVFVPVIGAMLGDASRTVISSVSVIKGTVGAVGTILIFSVIIPPLVIVVLNKLMLLLCAIAAKSLGCERESVLLYDLGGVLGVLLALVIGAGVVCIIAMAVFIKIGVAA